MLDKVGFNKVLTPECSLRLHLMLTNHLPMLLLNQLTLPKARLVFISESVFDISTYRWKRKKRATLGVAQQV